MSDLPLSLIFVAIFVGGMIIALVTSAKRLKTSGYHLRALGTQLNLDVIGGEPFFKSIPWLAFITKPIRIDGVYRDAPVKVWHFSRGSGRSSTPYIGLKMQISNPRGLSFQFSKEGFFSKVGKTLGMQDIEVGDTRFDRTFIVKCSDPYFIRTALLPEIKEKFYHAFEELGARGTIKLESSEIYYEESGRIRSEKVRERFAALIGLCADLRDTVSVYSEQT
ncbi:MAG: hypothetical protein GVY36_07435 [Verrucomicrobia bacterium]|jgi:hypothetical protein|nr:hypothetical protein [Verrucomicrobiota bacterium]